MAQTYVSFDSELTGIIVIIKLNHIKNKARCTIRLLWKEISYWNFRRKDMFIR
jgi:hypothetical protein